jgi:hypothetical protein
MRRLHLFEWEDQPWLPAVFRDFITDHLRYTHAEPMRRPINLAIARRLRGLLEQTGSHRIIDLCSGAAGPIVAISRILLEELAWPTEVVLTDLYPNVAAFERIEKASHASITSRHDSVNAMDVPLELEGVRTMFTALHHFRPELVRLVLADAVRKSSPIAVFEPLERTARLAIGLGLISLIRGFTHTPAVGPLSASRFLFTYVLPVAPFVFAWDGFVSALRSYSPEELHTIAVSTTELSRYKWETGRFEVPGPYGAMPTVYLIGTPD